MTLQIGSKELECKNKDCKARFSVVYDLGGRYGFAGPQNVACPECQHDVDLESPLPGLILCVNLIHVNLTA
jgi:hypothetical protein